MVTPSRLRFRVYTEMMEGVIHTTRKIVHRKVTLDTKIGLKKKITFTEDSTLENKERMNALTP